MTDIQSPYCKASEQATLGSILRTPEILGDVCELVSTSAFYFAAHQQIFDVLVQMSAAKAPIDIHAVGIEIGHRQLVEEIGGYSYLAEIWSSVGSGLNGPYYAAKVRDKFVAREIIRVCTSAIHDCHHPIGPVSEVMSDLQSWLMKLSGPSASVQVQSLAEVMRALQIDIDQRSRSKDRVGIPTGLTLLDSSLGGFHAGEFSILAARPSVGKTALAVQIARHAAEVGRQTLIFSIEQSAIELAGRLVSGRFPGASFAIRNGSLTHHDVLGIVQAAGELSHLPLKVVDASGCTLRTIEQVSRRERQRGQLDFVVIDYLGLIEPEDRRLNRTEQISVMTRSLKKLARELRIPILCLCQLKRGGEDRSEPKPRLSDLRDSGSIEQDADTVLFLHRASERRPDASTEAITFLVAKQRNGPCEEGSLIYRKSALRFEDNTLT